VRSSTTNLPYLASASHLVVHLVPIYFFLFLEICTDLANDILHCPDWDPSSTFSPHADKVPDPVLLPASVDFKQAKSLDVDIPLDTWGKVDDFIDDGIVIIPDLNTNQNHAIQAILLSIHTICQPLASSEPIAREDCLSPGNLAEEGGLSECIIIFGWVINTRSLTIALPQKKFKYRDANSRIIFSAKKVSYKKLESLIGQFNHRAVAFPIMRYFMHRILQVLHFRETSQKGKKVECYLPKQALEYLKLWQKEFLPLIHEGMS
jgi:hypothetical protein